MFKKRLPGENPAAHKSAVSRAALSHPVSNCRKEIMFIATKSENTRKVAKYAIAAFICTCLSEFVIVGIGYNTLSMYMTPILTENPQITRTAYALTLTLMSLFSALMETTIGKVREKIGLKGMFALGCGGAAVGFILYSVANSYALIVIAALVFGGSVAFCCGSWSGSVITTWFAKKTSTLLGIGMILSGISATIFSPVVGAWIENIGYRSSFLIEAGILAVTIIIMFIILKASPEKLGLKKMLSDDGEETSKKERKKFKSADSIVSVDVPFKVGVRHYSFWAILVCAVLSGITVYAVMNTLSVYAKMDLGFTAVVAGTVLSVMFALNSFGPPFIGFLTDVFGIKIVASTCIVLYAAGIFVMLVAPPTVFMLYIVAITVGIALSNARLIMPSLCKACFGAKDYTKYIGFFTGGLSVGIAFSSLIINAIYDACGSYDPALIAFIPVILICAVLVVTASVSGEKLQKKLSQQNTEA